MRFIQQQAQLHTPAASKWFQAIRAVAVLLGALILSWPAIYNGYPFLYPDSVSYLDSGRTVARALFLHQFSQDYGPRSVFYSLAIFPLRWGLALWPIVAMQCLLVAWVIWLVARSIAPRRALTAYLSLILFLSLLTSAGWYAAFIMPDILAAVLCLSIFLLAYARQRLSRVERFALCLIAVWCVTAHATHLLLAAGLCLLLAAAAALERRNRSERIGAVRLVAAIVVAAAVAQLAVYSHLDGKLSFSGQRPPYLMARVVSDGPGRWYLEQHCAQLQWEVCKDLPGLSADPESLLWGEHAAWESGTESERRQLEAEEMPLVLATLRAYPAQELCRSAANFRDQLRYFGMYAFNYNERLPKLLDAAMPQLLAGYLAGRQARDNLPLILLSHLQWGVIVASLAAIVILAAIDWRRLSRLARGLMLVTAVSVVGNAFITGVLSEPEHRYQCRIVWLIPLLAAILLLDWFEQRRPGDGIGEDEKVGGSVLAP